MRVPAPDEALAFGDVAATPVDEAAHPRVVRCVETCADYFLRTHGKQPAQRWAANLLGEALADGDRRLYTLAHGGHDALGLLELVFHGEAATLVLLAIDGARRGRGFGRMVWHGLTSELADRRFRSIDLGASLKEKPAVAFWTAMGLTPTRRRDGVQLFEYALVDG